MDREAQRTLELFEGGERSASLLEQLERIASRRGDEGLTLRLTVARGEAWGKILEQIDACHALHDDARCEALREQLTADLDAGYPLSRRRLPSRWLNAWSQGAPVRPLHRLAVALEFCSNVGLASLPALPEGFELEALELDSLDLASTPPEALAEHLSQPAMLSLKWLQLRRCRIGSLHVEALRASEGLRQIEHLDLSRNALGPGAPALLNGERLPALTSLSLVDTDQTDETISAIVNALVPDQLQTLKVGANYISWASAETLARCDTLSGLEHLEFALRRGMNGAGSVERLMQAPWLSNLEQLSLPWHPCGNAGAEAIAACEALTRLRRLDLSHCRIGARGAKALANAPQLMNLEELSLTGNEIGVWGARALAKGGLRSLRSLDLDRSGVGSLGARALASASQLSSLERLDLRDAGVRLGGIEAVVKLPGLRRVRLDQNPVSQTRWREAANKNERLSEVACFFEPIDDGEIRGINRSPDFGHPFPSAEVTLGASLACAGLVIWAGVVAPYGFGAQLAAALMGAIASAVAGLIGGALYILGAATHGGSPTDSDRRWVRSWGVALLAPGPIAGASAGSALAWWALLALTIVSYAIRAQDLHRGSHGAALAARVVAVALVGTVGALFGRAVW